MYKQGKSEGFHLKAATDLVILLKLDLNRRFFGACDLEIWRMTFKNNSRDANIQFSKCLMILWNNQKTA